MPGRPPGAGDEGRLFGAEGRVLGVDGRGAAALPGLDGFEPGRADGDEGGVEPGRIEGLEPGRCAGAEGFGAAAGLATEAAGREGVVFFGSLLRGSAVRAERLVLTEWSEDVRPLAEASVPISPRLIAAMAGRSIIFFITLLFRG